MTVTFIEHTQPENTTMREYVIILPRTEAYACEWLRTQLLDLFGGYTEHEATGAWRAPNDEVIYDDNSVFTVATDRLDAMTEFRHLALTAGRIGNQQSVYLKSPEGLVEFVEVTA